MKTIKVIDLLNKIANGEEVPKKIKYDGYIWNFYDNKVYQSYWNEENINLEDYFDGYIIKYLADEVEIIEEDKKIEKIKSNGIEFYSDYINVWIKKEETVAYCEYLMNKVNELIDAVNELKRGN